jgi:peptidyl-prolyl cis-trans isomerase C
LSNKFTRLIREPLVQFLLIGAAIYTSYFLYGEPPQEEQDRTIVITSDYVDSLTQSFAKRWNRPPTDDEVEGLVGEYIRESLLYREALSMGLDKEDHIIRRRLAQKLEFLTNDLVKLTPPEDAVLQQYLDDNLDKFRNSDLLTFTQVFVDPDKRGDSTLPYATELLGQLQAAGQPNDKTFELGDRFMLQSEFINAPYREIQRHMGQEFTDSAMQLEAGRWHGPVLSGYGIHLVYIAAHSKATEPSLADVRDKVQAEYLHEQTQKFNAEYLDVLRKRYTIVSETPIEGIQDKDNVGTTP